MARGYFLCCANNMSFFAARIVKWLIAIIAVVNIVVMMVFQYGLPSLAVSAEEIVETTDTEEMGTIETVQQETAAKEAEIAEAALAREDDAEEEIEEEDEEEERDPDAPTLELIDDHIYLRKGEHFNYMSYIKTMEDVDGSDLSHYIYLDKDVDTDEPGEIDLTYRITSTITGKSDSKVLKITIEE